LAQLGLNLGYLLVQIFNFLIILIVLYAWVYKPILGLLEKRRLSIAQGLEDARIAGEARANAEQEARRIISDAQASANEKMREAAERAETTRRELVAEAESEAARVRDAARDEAEQERERILGNMRNQVAAIAMAAAQKLVGAALTDQNRQHQLIQEFFSGMQDGRIQALEGVELQGAAAEITSAVLLTDAEKEAVRQQVLSKIGTQSTVTFRVDPAILGGLVVQVGDKVLDGSVAGQLEEMRQRIR
jgi:F-type H+-transporting ATPase subunit b